MNLTEILQYRTTCLVHSKPMLPKCLDQGAKKIQIQENGIKVVLNTDVYKSKATFFIFFNFDGTVDYNAQAAITRFRTPLYFLMQCEDCATMPIGVTVAAGKGTKRLNGATSLREVRRQQHFYSFDIQVRADNTFTCIPEQEVIRYHRDNKFYHMSANLIDGSAKFKMGNCNSSEIINQLLSSLMKLEVPKFDPSTIKSIDQMVEKIQIYNLFS